MHAAKLRLYFQTRKRFLGKVSEKVRNPHILCYKVNICVNLDKGLYATMKRWRIDLNAVEK